MIDCQEKRMTVGFESIEIEEDKDGMSSTVLCKRRRVYIYPLSSVLSD